MKKNYVYIGLDKGRYNNSAIFMDEDQTVMKRLRFETTHQGCKTLLKEIKAITSSLNRIPVIGFEGKNDHFKPLIEELQKIEAILKPVSPLSIKRYKDILFTVGEKGR